MTDRPDHKGRGAGQLRERTAAVSDALAPGAMHERPIDRHMPVAGIEPGVGEAARQRFGTVRELVVNAAPDRLNPTSVPLRPQAHRGRARRADTV